MKPVLQRNRASKFIEIKRMVLEASIGHFSRAVHRPRTMCLELKGPYNLQSPIHFGFAVPFACSRKRRD
jgi:hypothetical protein